MAVDIEFLKSYGGLLLLFLIVFYIVAKTLLRGFFWKIKKTGEELSFKQFFKLWRKGVDGVTPIQQSFSQVLGTWIVLSGILCGIIVNLLVRLKNVWWWLTVILTGSLLLTIMQQIGALQKYWRIKEVEKVRKELENDNKKRKKT